MLGPSLRMRKKLEYPPWVTELPCSIVSYYKAVFGGPAGATFLPEWF